ncbi:MAG: terminase gpA endonuclease subunit [Fuerstiella sp.]
MITEQLVFDAVIGLSRARLAGRCKRGFQKRVPADPLQWMSQHVRFPKTWEWTNFDLKKMPHVRGFIERFWLDPTKRKANLPWGVRSGKTTTLMAVICWIALNDPAPMGILFPDRKMLVQALREHIYPMLERTRPVAKQLLPRPKRGAYSITFKDCRVRLANAGTLSDSSGWPAKYIFKFEHDKCPVSKMREADASRRIESRTSGYARGVKIVEEGSPGDVRDSRAARLLKSKTVQQVRYNVPCPHCGEYQALQFDQLRIPRQALEDCNAMLAARESKYHCAVCDEVIEDHQRAAMMQGGLWLIEGEYIDANGVICGTPKVDSDTMVFGGYSMLYSLFVESWGAIAKEWVEAVEAQRGGDLEALKRFKTEVLAEPWEDRPTVTQNDKLAEFLKGEHVKGQCPEGTAFIGTTADVGMMSEQLVFHWQVMAWQRGAQGAIVDWGITVGSAKFLDWIQGQQYEIAESGLYLPVKDFQLGVDSGKYSTEVYGFVDMVGGQAFALKGDSRTGENVGVDLYYPSQRKSDIPAELVALRKKMGVSDLWFINSEKTQQYRQALANMTLQPGVKGFVTMPVDVCEDYESWGAYFDQLKADYKEKNKWKRSGANEAGDNLRYGRALAQKATRNGLLWDSVALPKKYNGLPKVIEQVRGPVRKKSPYAGGSYLLSNR